jgi:hypothetical protein
MKDVFDVALEIDGANQTFGELGPSFFGTFVRPNKYQKLFLEPFAFCPISYKGMVAANQHANINKTNRFRPPFFERLQSADRSKQ